MEKVIASNSDNIKIKGHIGTWYVLSSAKYPQGTLYLLEHETYGDEAPSIIVDSYGNIVLEDVYNGWDDLDEYTANYLD